MFPVYSMFNTRVNGLQVMIVRRCSQWLMIAQVLPLLISYYTVLQRMTQVATPHTQISR
jgi:hypothetical protein